MIARQHSWKVLAAMRAGQKKRLEDQAEKVVGKAAKDEIQSQDEEYSVALNCSDGSSYRLDFSFSDVPIREDLPERSLSLLRTVPRSVTSLSTRCVPSRGY